MSICMTCGIGHDCKSIGKLRARLSASEAKVNALVIDRDQCLDGQIKAEAALSEAVANVWSVVMAEIDRRMGKGSLYLWCKAADARGRGR